MYSYCVYFIFTLECGKRTVNSKKECKADGGIFMFWYTCILNILHESYILCIIKKEGNSKFIEKIHGEGFFKFIKVIFC